MTHDEILKAARERLAEIDREKARLEDERGSLQALLGVQPTPQFVPVLPPMSPGIAWPEQWRHVPEVTWTPYTGLPGTLTVCTTCAPTPTIDTFGTFGITAEFPLLAFNEDFAPHSLVIGGTQGPNPSIRYIS